MDVDILHLQKIQYYKNNNKISSLILVMVHYIMNHLAYS